MRLRAVIAKIAAFKGVPTPEDVDAFLDECVPAIVTSETFQQAFGITEAEMEGLYAEGYEFYQKDHFTEALAPFRMLVYLNPFVIKYWMGLGATLQLVERYENALKCYSVAAMLDCNDPYPHFHAYECYMGLHNEEEAEKALRLAYKRAKQHPTYGPLRATIEQLRQPVTT